MVTRGLQLGGYHNTAGIQNERDQLELAWEQFKEQQDMNNFAKNMGIINGVMQAIGLGSGVISGMQEMGLKKEALAQDATQFDKRLGFDEKALEQNAGQFGARLAQDESQFDASHSLAQDQFAAQKQQNLMNTILSAMGLGIQGSTAASNIDIGQRKMSLEEQAAATEQSRYQEGAPFRQSQLELLQGQGQSQNIQNMYDEWIKLGKPSGNVSESPMATQFALENSLRRRELESPPSGMTDLFAMAGAGKMPASILASLFPQYSDQAEALKTSQTKNDVLAKLQAGEIGTEEWKNLPNLPPELMQRIGSFEQMPGFWKGGTMGPNPFTSAFSIPEGFKARSRRNREEEALRRLILQYYGGY